MIIDNSSHTLNLLSMSKVISNCESHTVELDALTTGVVSDIPIILSSHTVNFYSNPLIKLPLEISKVTDIKNKLIITNYTFLQDPNVLFIKGFIRKSIYYLSILSHNNLKHSIIHVPFECSTSIKLSSPHPSSNINKTFAEADTPKSNKEASFSNMDNYLSTTNQSDFNKISDEFFNTKPYCEVVRVRISEHCKYICRKDHSSNSKILDSNNIVALKDSMAIKLDVLILQNQKVCIGPSTSTKNTIINCNNDNSIDKPHSITDLSIDHDSNWKDFLSSLDFSDSSDNLVSTDNSNSSNKTNSPNPLNIPSSISQSPDSVLFGLLGLGSMPHPYTFRTRFSRSKHPFQNHDNTTGYDVLLLFLFMLILIDLDD